MEPLRPKSQVERWPMMRGIFEIMTPKLAPTAWTMNPPPRSVMCRTWDSSGVSYSATISVRSKKRPVRPSGHHWRNQYIQETHQQFVSFWLIAWSQQQREANHGELLRLLGLKQIVGKVEIT